MTVARPKGHKGLADILFSRIIRSRGFCQYPGCPSIGPYDTAHIIGRSASGTRCIEDNAWCLGQSHHRLVDAWWDEKHLLVMSTIGEERYRELKHLAGEHKFRPVTSAVYWAEEVDRLKAICRAMDLSDKRTA
jgi:hypothetical protein